ncbi:YadA-like family protein [Rhodococcus sp. 06-156-3C]
MGDTGQVEAVRCFLVSAGVATSGGQAAVALGCCPSW